MTLTHLTALPNRPSWISSDLATSATSLQANLANITILITPSSVTFVHPSGDSYHHSISAEPDISLADVPEPQLVPPASPQPPTDLLLTGPGTPPLTLPIPDPELQLLLDDLRDASPAPITLPPCPPDEPAPRTEYLLRRFARTQRNPINMRLHQLHLAYLLGQLLQFNPTETKACLRTHISEARKRGRLICTAERVYQVGSRVGLPRLYGTQRLSIRALRELSGTTFRTVFLPHVDLLLPSTALWSSEDLTFLPPGDV